MVLALVWGKDMANICADLPTDGAFIAVSLGINRQLDNAIFESGAYKGLQDARITEGFSLKVRELKGGDCS